MLANEPLASTVLSTMRESLQPAENHPPIPHSPANVMVLPRMVTESVRLPRRSTPQSQTLRIELPSITRFASFSIRIPSSAPGGKPPGGYGWSCQLPSMALPTTRLFVPSLKCSTVATVLRVSAVKTLSATVISLDRDDRNPRIRQL